MHNAEICQLEPRRISECRKEENECGNQVFTGCDRTASSVDIERITVPAACLWWVRQGNPTQLSTGALCELGSSLQGRMRSTMNLGPVHLESL